MKKLIALALLVACSTTSFAWADGPDHRDDHQQWQNGSQGGHDQRGPQQDYDRGNNRGHDEGRGPDRDHQMSQRDHFASGGHDFRRGHAVPPDFRGDRYRVNDWNDRGLPRPPEGQHWSYIDGNYVLIAAATGIIGSILYSAIAH